MNWAADHMMGANAASEPLAHAVVLKQLKACIHVVHPAMYGAANGEGVCQKCGEVFGSGFKTAGEDIVCGELCHCLSCDVTVMASDCLL